MLSRAEVCDPTRVRRGCAGEFVSRHALSSGGCDTNGARSVRLILETYSLERRLRRRVRRLTRPHPRVSRHALSSGACDARCCARSPRRGTWSRDILSRAEVATTQRPSPRSYRPGSRDILSRAEVATAVVTHAPTGVTMSRDMLSRAEVAMGPTGPTGSSGSASRDMLSRAGGCNTVRSATSGTRHPGLETCSLERRLRSVTASTDSGTGSKSRDMLSRAEVAIAPIIFSKISHIYHTDRERSRFDRRSVSFSREATYVTYEYDCST